MKTIYPADIKQIAYNMVIGLSPVDAVIQSGFSKSRAHVYALLENIKDNRDFLDEIEYYERLVTTGEIERLEAKQAEDNKNQEMLQQLKSFLQGLINFDLSEHLEEIEMRDGQGNDFMALSITSLEALKTACPYIKRMKFLREGVILEFYDKSTVTDQLMKIIETERKAKPQDIQINFSVIKETNPNRDLIMSRIESAISREEDF
jgi:hypothetical protein